MSELREYVRNLAEAEEAVIDAKREIREYLRTKANTNEVSLYTNIDWQALRRDHRN